MHDYHSYIAILTQNNNNPNIWKDYILPVLPSFLAIFSGALISYISARYALRNSIKIEEIKEKNKSLGLLKIILIKVQVSRNHCPLIKRGSDYPHITSTTPILIRQHNYTYELLTEVSRILETNPSILTSFPLPRTLNLISRISNYSEESLRNFSQSSHFIDSIEIPHLYDQSIEEVEYYLKNNNN